jgi:hypothetical protein
MGAGVAMFDAADGEPSRQIGLQQGDRLPDLALIAQQAGLSEAAVDQL